MTTWTNHEEARLRAVYPAAATPVDLLQALPRHTIEAIRAHARALGLARPRPQDGPPVACGLIRELTARRLALGLSQRELALRTGVDRVIINRAERGRAGVSVRTLQRWAAELGLAVALVPIVPPDAADE